jgi:hypothetical protein
VPRRPRAIALELPGLPTPAFRPSTRLRRSKSKRRPSPAPLPWECVALGVDTARRSGWSVWARGHLIARGELDTLDEAALREVISRVLAGAAELGLPAVLVLEKPWGGAADLVAALGAAAERWLKPWRELAVGHRGRVVRVQPTTWRSAVLPDWYPQMPREECRAEEQRFALALSGATDIGGDEAPAVCIGYWGSRAGEVGRLLSKTTQRASLAAWGGGA